MENIIIYGAGDLGCEYAWFIEEINEKNQKWNLIGFVDDKLPIGKTISGYKVLGGKEFLFGISEKVNVICAIANPVTRKKIVTALQKCPFVKFPVLVHPSTILPKMITIGEGTVIGPDCVISISVVIGKHVIINQNSSISHHAEIGDYAMIAPGCNLGGYSKIDEAVSMGLGCSVIPLCSIGKHTIMGAGAVVVKNIPSYCTAVGVPAKPIKFIKDTEL